MARQRHWDVERANQSRRRVDDIRNRVDDTHGRGRHGSAASTTTFRLAERHLAVDVRVADDVDPVGRVALRARPLGHDVAWPGQWWPRRCESSTPCLCCCRRARSAEFGGSTIDHPAQRLCHAKTRCRRGSRIRGPPARCRLGTVRRAPARRNSKTSRSRRFLP
ncbi:MAG: hypothetical protein QOI30_1185 [Mycobacterium sp.]|nr:hypothetical protein [Mycobacterium sp.]